MYPFVEILQSVFLLYFPKDHVQKHAMTRNHVEGDVHIDTSMTRMAAIPANVIID